MNKKDKKFYKIFVAVFLLLVFLNYIGSLNYVSNFLISSFESFNTYLKPDNNPEYSMSKEEMVQEIEYLRKELDGSRVDLALFESLRQENQELRDFFGFVKDLDYNYLATKLVWSENLLNFTSINQNLVINKGSNDGIVPGLAVLNDSGILIGKVLEVEEDYSKICLASNSFCKIAVSISNEDNSSGLAEGNLGLSVLVNYISQTDEVAVGDLVFSSGLEDYIPRGLYLGEVIDVRKNENDIWQNIFVKTFFEIGRLNNLIVVMP